MSNARDEWLRAHAALWYGDARYRLAWFGLPQVVTLGLAGLCLSLAAQGEWGQPATASKARVAELTTLRDRAGKEGDLKAFQELTAAATRNQIDAATKLGTLYDPLTAAYFPKKPSPNDFSRARCPLCSRRRGGDLLAITRLADVLLDPANPNGDLKRGCRLAQTWMDDPETLKPHDLRRGARHRQARQMLCRARERPAAGSRQGGRAGDRRAVAQAPADHRRLRQQSRHAEPGPGGGDPAPSSQVRALYRPRGRARQSRHRHRPPGGGRDPEHRRGPAARAAQGGAERAGPGSHGPGGRRMAGDRGKMAQLKSRADSGDADAQIAYARLFNPVRNKGQVFAPDAQVAVAYYERAAAAGNVMAAGEAASIYDQGWGNVAKDPKKAAALALRGVDLKDDQVTFWLLFEEAGSWSGPFWGALQAELTARGFYTLPSRTSATPPSSRPCAPT